MVVIFVVVRQNSTKMSKKQWLSSPWPGLTFANKIKFICSLFFRLSNGFTICVESNTEEVVHP